MSEAMNMSTTVTKRKVPVKSLSSKQVLTKIYGYIWEICTFTDGDKPTGKGSLKSVKYQKKMETKSVHVNCKGLTKYTIYFYFLSTCTVFMYTSQVNTSK